jgi:hypothetical protein
VNQATKNVAADQAQDKSAADTADLGARTDQAEAQAGNLAAQTALHTNQAESDKPFDVTREMANAAGVPELAGQRVSQQTYQKLFGGTQATGTRKIIADDQNATRVETTGMNNDTSRANNKDTNATHETIADAANKTKVLLGQMHDATSLANNQNTNDHKVGSDGNYKVPADVTKRAALASNVLENADQVSSILKQHPEIVGATGGRYSNVQQMIGSNDPNIQALGVRIHNIALASNGAHGVRSQEAVRDTENELFNHFKAGPQAIQSGLNALTSSVQTFLNDEKNFSTTGKRAGGSSDSSHSGKADFVFVPGKGLVPN